MPVLTVFTSATILFSACATSPPETRPEMLARTTGTVTGVVVDRASGVPISGVEVEVSSQYLGDVTDRNGAYKIVYLDPGNESILAWRRDTVQERVPVTVVAGESTTLNISVDKSPSACCRLEGDWSIELTVDTADWVIETARSPLKGTIQFDDATPDPFGERRTDTNDETVDEFGFYEIDFRRFLGADYYASAIRAFSPNGEDPDFLREVSGYITNENVVEILLIPRVSDFGFGLSGTIHGDIIEGRWLERAFAGGIRGTFTMTRQAD